MGSNNMMRGDLSYVPASPQAKAQTASPTMKSNEQIGRNGGAAPSKNCPLVGADPPAGQQHPSRLVTMHHYGKLSRKPNPQWVTLLNSVFAQHIRVKRGTSYAAAAARILLKMAISECFNCKGYAIF
jgi:hypothetical protein